MTPRKYEQKLRAESAEQTRRRIFDALEERLRAAPAEPVSVDRVARMAGVARSTVYLVFGSRDGLWDAFARDLFERAGYGRLIEAVQHDDAREHMRGGLRTGVEMFASYRDVARAIYGMARLDAGSLGGAVGRIEQERARGMTRLAGRLHEQGHLRGDVTVEQAADVLWVLAGFEAFDQLYTGRGLSVEETAATLHAMAERSLLAECAA